MSESIRIFYSYSHEDERLLKRLKKHLSLLLQEGTITEWHDRNISAGTEWEHEIDSHLDTAHIILLLVSSDFMASEYCQSVEVKRAMERHDVGEAHVIPIILRSVDWQGAPFSRLQALPTDGIPVTDRKWHNQDKAFANIAQGIRTVIEERTTKAYKLGVDRLSPTIEVLSDRYIKRPHELEQLKKNILRECRFHRNQTLSQLTLTGEKRFRSKRCF